MKGNKREEESPAAAVEPKKDIPNVEDLLSIRTLVGILLMAFSSSLASLDFFSLNRRRMR
jgi:hypothetical protein